MVAFAQKHGILIIHDAAYAALAYGRRPLSFLATPGAKEVGVEIHSLSKSFNMTGWRLAFVAGNPGIVSAYATVKDNTDSGQFIAIQKAGAAALANPWITEEIAAKYERRLRRLVALLGSLGFDATMSDGTYLPVSCGRPRGRRRGRPSKTPRPFRSI